MTNKQILGAVGIVSVALGVLMISLLFSGCSRDLNDKEAARLIEAHFHAVAPTMLEDFKINIVEILSPDDNNRQVRFTEKHKDVYVDLEVELNKVWDTNTPSTFIHSVYFQKSTKGWTLKKYGPGTVNLMKRLRAERLAVDYEPVLQVVSMLRLAAMKLSMDPEKISEKGIKTYLAELNVKISNGINWGLLVGDYTTQHLIVWAREANNPQVICAVNAAFYRQKWRNFPKEFSWLDENYLSTPTCVGKTHRFNIKVLMDEADSVIENNDGLFPPYRGE